MTAPEKRLTEAQRAVLAELADHGQWQREDGLECAPGVLRLGFGYFDSLILRWRGLIERKRFPGHTSWASCRKLWFFRITDAGRARQEGVRHCPGAPPR